MPAKQIKKSRLNRILVEYTCCSGIAEDYEEGSLRKHLTRKEKKTQDREMYEAVTGNRYIQVDYWNIQLARVTQRGCREPVNVMITRTF